MDTAAPKGGGDGDSKTTGCSNSTPRAAAQVAIPDLPAFRARLVAARARLVERIILEYDPDRRFPDSGWTRMLADIQATIGAVDAMIAEAGR